MTEAEVRAILEANAKKPHEEWVKVDIRSVKPGDFVRLLGSEVGHVIKFSNGKIRCHIFEGVAVEQPYDVAYDVYKVRDRIERRQMVYPEVK